MRVGTDLDRQLMHDSPSQLPSAPTLTPHAFSSASSNPLICPASSALALTLTASSWVTALLRHSFCPHSISVSCCHMPPLRAGSSAEGIPLGTTPGQLMQSHKCWLQPCLRMARNPHVIACQDPKQGDGVCVHVSLVLSWACPR